MFPYFKIMIAIISIATAAMSMDKFEFEKKSELYDDFQCFLPRSMTEDVLFSMSNIDPEQDIVLFDFDETMAKTSHLSNPKRANEKITVRSNGGVLDLFKSMRDSNPGSAFIYSSGSVFYARHHEIDLPLIAVDSEKMAESCIFATEQSSEGEMIYKGNIHGILSYFPQFPAFHLNWKEQPKILQINQILEGIKGAHLGHIIHFIYEKLGRTTPIRDIYLIDDQQNNLSSMTVNMKELKDKEHVTGHFIPIHVPYSQRE